MLNKTDSGCPGCHVVDDTLMPYPLYWTMSVNDWFHASGNETGFRLLLIEDILILILISIPKVMKLVSICYLQIWQQSSTRQD